MVIGFTGAAGSGKDTAGAYLIKKYNFERRSFVDTGKNSMAEFFNIERWELDSLKNEPDARITLHTATYSKSMDLREGMQRYMHHAHRVVFGNDFWLNITLPVGGYYVGRKIVITDVSYQNEVDRINYLGGLVVRIVGRGKDNESPHREYDSGKLKLGIMNYSVPNTGTFEEFYKEIDKALDYFVAK